MVLLVHPALGEEDKLYRDVSDYLTLTNLKKSLKGIFLCEHLSSTEGAWMAK